MPYKVVDQPAVLPRPDLESIDVNFRRIPVMAVGSQIYADSQRVIDEVEALASKPLYPAESKAALPGLKLFGDSIFRTAIYTIPAQAITPEFAKDRAPVFPALVDPNFKHIGPYAKGEMKALLSEVQSELLGNGEKKWVFGGSSPTLGDGHVAWVCKWSLFDLGLGQQDGFGEKDLPIVYDWIKRFLEIAGKDDAPKISGEEAKKIILDAVGGDKAGATVDKDPLGLSEGEKVLIYPTDAEPTHPQEGSLVILNPKEVAIQLQNKAVLHFPRIGYRIVKEGAELV